MRDRKSSVAMWSALICAFVIIMCFGVTRSPGEDKETYQAGTVVDVKTHAGAPAADDATKQYDVSVKVGNKIYVVLYTPPKGQNAVEYSVGMNRNVLVEGKTMKFVDMMGRTTTMPILSSKDAPADKPK